MKETKEQQLDKVISEAMQKTAVKSPSVDFTQTLMSKIQATQVSQTTIVYQPLISRRVWALLATIFVLLIGYVSFSNIGFTTVSGVLKHSFDTVGSWNIPTWNLPSLEVSLATSSPFVYGALILVSFLLIEIVILKRKYS